MKKKSSLTIGLILVFVGGGVLGYLWGNHRKANTPAPSSVVRANSPEYKFTNPILLSQSNSGDKSSSLDPLRRQISDYVTDVTQAGKASNVSVLVRNMNSGAWTGVNETDTYAPGSMLKVPILMAYLSAGSDDTDLLDERLYYNPQVDQGQYFKPPKTLPPGTYSVRDLMKNMIIESDNTATLILANHHPDIVEKVYSDLHLPSPTVGTDFMSPMQYSTFWRALYNATYISHDLSEESLDLLSLTTFDDGLVAGLPAGAKVSHKFGEHTDVYPDKPAVHELHDCGIVYPPNIDPYFVCVMTRGSDFSTLEKIISDLSKITYTGMTK